MLFLTLLFVCHFLADFTWLSRPHMLKAKRFGTPIWPILHHAWVHGILMFITSLFFLPFYFAVLVLVIQILAHWAIDIGKGRVTYLIKSTQDSTKVEFWILFGFDQFLHQLTIILMWYLI